ncbi:MAG: preprotein translocase subunit YajC [Verrucomicrobiota bacterium]|nr:preprotein translocase subunit YajC [Verrucomicrobiota bacterium]
MTHLNALNVVLAAAPAQPQPPSGPMGLFASPLTLLVLMAVMMYFVLFRPQQQQRARHAQLLKNLKSGDRVVTASGIVGVIITVKDKTVSLRSADAKMEMTKSSVTEILEPAGNSTAS